MKKLITIFSSDTVYRRNFHGIYYKDLISITAADDLKWPVSHNQAYRYVFYLWSYSR
jgi:hypothetical protein